MDAAALAPAVAKLDTVLKRADEALYQAKREGPDRLVTRSNRTASLAAQSR
jgi:PleD family two-component response regulator